MNEVMLALEAMIRRIVKEELVAAAPIATAPSMETIPEFNLRVKAAILDQPWFDEAISSEVLAAGLTAPVAANPDANAVLVALRDAGPARDYLAKVISDGVHDDILHSATIHDHFVTLVQDVGFELRRDYIEDVINDYDFDDKVDDRIGSYDFTQIVDSIVDIEDSVRDCVRGLAFSVSVD